MEQPSTRDASRQSGGFPALDCGGTTDGGTFVAMKALATGLGALSLVALAALAGCGSSAPSTFVDAGPTDASASDAPADVVVDSPIVLPDVSTPKTPVKAIPGLVSITYFETTGAVNSYTFTVNGPEMNTKIATMSAQDNDIKGANSEYYDVYYSDDQGNFDANGAYLTIAGVFLYKLPAVGGLNLAEIALNYNGQPPEYGNYVASFVALGDNAIPGDVGKAIDGNLNTCSTMGNTVDDPGKLLRITLGFKSSSGPPK